MGWRVISILLGLLSVAPAAFAQDIASADAPAASPAQELSAVERWQLDPAEVFEGDEVTLGEFLYVARPVVIFADSPNDPRFTEQLGYLLDRIDDLVVRDVVIIVDTDPAAASEIRRQLRPRGFGLVLISKDGRVAQRKPVPWDVREIGRAIDKMPLRQQEIRDRR